VVDRAREWLISAGVSRECIYMLDLSPVSFNSVAAMHTASLPELGGHAIAIAVGFAEGQGTVFHLT
jgi:hypothetical protein